MKACDKHKLQTSEFANCGLELTFRQACTAKQTGEVEFLDIHRCIFLFIMVKWHC